MRSPKVLIISEDDGLCQSLKNHLYSCEFKVIGIQVRVRAHRSFQSIRHDLVIIGPQSTNHGDGWVRGCTGKERLINADIV